MATEPTPAPFSAGAPRPSRSNAVRAAGTADDHSRTTAGLPFSAASERVAPDASWSEKSGAGNGSYNQVASGADAGGGAVAAACDRDRGANGSALISPASTIVTRVFNATSVNVCVAPEGHATVSFAIRPLGPRPTSSSFECSDRKPEPACTVL